METERLNFTDSELLYAATARCRCGAGVAYPLDHKDAMAMGAWVCAAVLKRKVDAPATEQSLASFKGTAPIGEHDSYAFAFYKIREETSINNVVGHTTRPPGTVARTVGKAVCPTCKHEWESEPYSACGLGHHWISGPCPNCGHAVGGDVSYSTSDGPAIEKRYRTVVIKDAG